MNLIEGDAKGFFSPQEGGPCKLTIVFDEKNAQDAAFLLRNKRVVIGLAENGEAPDAVLAVEPLDKMAHLINELQQTLSAAKQMNSAKKDTTTPGLFVEPE